MLEFIIVVAFIGIIFLWRRGGIRLPSTGWLGTMSSGGNNPLVIAVVMTVIIAVVTWYQSSFKLDLAHALLFALHLWIAYKLLDGGLKPTWSGGFRVAYLATLYLILYQHGPGKLIVNDINNVDAAATKMAEGGSGLFTSGDKATDSGISGNADCPQNVVVPMTGMATITVLPGCTATLDTTGLPVEERHVLVDIDPGDKGPDKEDPSDVAKVNYTVDAQNELNGVKIKLDAGVEATSFIAYRKNLK